MNTVRSKRTAAFVLVLAALAFASVVALAGCSQDSSESTTEEVVLELSCSTDDEAIEEAGGVSAWASEAVYNEEAQATIAEELQAEHDGQTLDEPLVEYNPFGSNTQSLYVYFETEEAASVSYTVSVTDEEVANLDAEIDGGSIADFTREVADGEAVTEHEFQVIGLVPGITNTVTFTATYEDGSTESSAVSVAAAATLGDEELQLEVTEGDSTEELTDGLYVILGNDSNDDDFVYMYDNDGILRSEIPIVGYRAHRLLFDDEGVMYYSADYSMMAGMNELGQIVGVYDLGSYELHHDYVWDANGDMLVLASDQSQTDTVEDMILRLDVETGEYELALDMGTLLGSYRDEAIAYHEANYEPVESDNGDESDEDGVDWIHLNSIQYLEDEDAIIVSAREISSIIKVDNFSTDPELTYILSSQEFWEGTEYEQYVYDQASDFTVQGGQHAVTYVEDESLDEGQYYLYMYNNNIGLSEAVTHDFDYANVGLENDAAVSDEYYSSYYLYLVDENEGTFDLVDSLDVVLSGYVSVCQWYDGGIDEGNLIIDSGIPGVFAEYDSDKNLIRSFYMEPDKNFLYRVMKYDL